MIFLLVLLIFIMNDKLDMRNDYVTGFMLCGFIEVIVELIILANILIR